MRGASVTETSLPRSPGPGQTTRPDCPKQRFGRVGLVRSGRSRARRRYSPPDAPRILRLRRAPAPSLTEHAPDAATDFSVADRVVVVTGASAGIGHSIAGELARAGARVAAVARRVDLLEALAAEVDGVTPFACDLLDAVSREQLVERIVSDMGPVDGLVNNAALTGRGAPATRESLDEVQTMLDINLKAPLDLAVRFLLSDASCFITGQEIAVDGGYSIT